MSFFKNQIGQLSAELMRKEQKINKLSKYRVTHPSTPIKVVSDSTKTNDMLKS